MGKNVMVGEFGREEFLAKVSVATDRFKAIYDRGLSGFKPFTTRVAPLTKDYKDIIASMRSQGFCQELIDAQIANLKLFEKKAEMGGKVTTPKPVDLKNEKLTFVPFAAVVILRNRNHHAYTIGDTYVMVHGEEGANYGMFGMDSKGCIINRSTTAKDGLSHLPRFRASIRPATSIETLRFVNKLYGC